MASRIKEEEIGPGEEGSQDQVLQGKSKQKRNNKQNPPVKRRCVSTACIACRRRKSKCDGNTPSCAACSSVYHTPCVYDPNSDHRRKGVYKKDIDNLKTRNTTLQTLVQAILNYDEDEVFDLVRQMRTAESLEDVAESISARAKGLGSIEEGADSHDDDDSVISDIPQFESELAGKMSQLTFDGSGKFIGGTSNLIFLPPGSELNGPDHSGADLEIDARHDSEDPITSWTTVTKNKELIRHLLTMYFTWHYAYFTTLSKHLFYRDFVEGRSSQYCSSLLVNAMLALGCHFSTWPASRSNPENSATAGNHFFKEAKRLLMEGGEHEKAKLCTVQALALMSVREAGCGREGKGWVYSGMSFRMAYDLGLNVDSAELYSNIGEEEADARRITFWGCFLFDKCWSNYLGRQPQLPASNISVPKPDVFPSEDAETWSAYTDSGVIPDHTQPSRTRAVSLQITLLCEISGELLAFFYHPTRSEKPAGKQAELKQLTSLHTRLEAWKKNLPKEMEPGDGQLPHVLVMHMFFHLLYIHLYRPFLKYTKSTSPLPSHVSPRKLCVQAASSISKLLRTYKRSYGLQQICNIAVYIAHTACTIHLLNLPDKNAQRDIVHGLKNLEEIGESWLCARRTLRILDLSASKWNIELPHQALLVFERTHAKYGSWGSWDQVQSPTSSEEYGILAAPQMSPKPPINLMTPEPMQGSNQFVDSQSVNMHPRATPHPIEEPPPLPCARTFSTSRSSPPACICDRSARMNAGSGSHQQIPCLLYTHQAQPPQQTQQPQQPPQQQPQQEYMTSMPPQQQQQLASDVTTGAVTPSVATPQSYTSGGMRNLVRESQDWWLKDQNALALGMNNWVDDWSGNPDMDFESDPSTAANPLDVGGGSGGVGSREQSLMANAPTSNATNNTNVTGPGTPVVQLKMEDCTPPGVGYPIGLDQGGMNQYYFDTPL